MATPEDVREAVPGEAAEAESVMAPQATNDPTAVNPAQPSGPSTDGPPEPKLPPGQCQNCGTLVFRAEIERHEGRPPCHRARKSRHDLVGELCGPVITVWVYHVAFRGLDDKLHAGQVALAMPMERGNSMQIASRMLSGLILGELSVLRPGDETSPLVEILWWTALGMA